jgi:hypothetical protein
MTTTRLSAFMLTTTRTSEGDPTFLNTMFNSVKTGNQVRSSLATRRAASNWSAASIVMGGKSNNFTLLSIRQSHVQRAILALKA